MYIGTVGGRDLKVYVRTGTNPPPRHDRRLEGRRAVTSFRPHAEYIETADILMVRVRDAAIARTLNLGHWRNIDLDDQGRVVAAEFINAGGVGVDLDGVPERDTIAQLVREAH